MFNFRLAFVLVACVSLAACVIDPPSRTSQEFSQPTALAGFVGSPGQDITIQAVDQNSGSLVTLGTATSSPSATPYTAPSGTSYKLYRWSFDTGVLAANLWSPQEIVPDLKTAQGHLDLRLGRRSKPLHVQPGRAGFLAGVRQRPCCLHA